MTTTATTSAVIAIRSCALPLNLVAIFSVSPQSNGTGITSGEVLLDVSHHSIPSITELSSTAEESLSPPLRSINHPSLSPVSCTASQSTSPLHPCEPQSDSTSDVIGCDGCSLQKSSSEPVIGDSSPCEKAPAPFPDRSDTTVGVKSIVVGYCGNAFLLTYSGEVYGWGCNRYESVLYNGPNFIKSPVKLPLNDVINIVCCGSCSFAITSSGSFYGWGGNQDDLSMPITPINIPYNFKEVCSGKYCVHALTHDGQVVILKDCFSFSLIEGLNNVVSISVHDDAFVAIDEIGEVFFCKSSKYTDNTICKLHVAKHLPLKAPLEGSFCYRRLFCNYILLVDGSGAVWQFNQSDTVDNIPIFNEKPTKIPGLSNIVSICGSWDVCAAIDNNGKVFVWGRTSNISYYYEDTEEPRCIEAFTNIEGVSVDENFLFAYNKNSVWAWGMKVFGTDDVIDRPHPIKLSIGSEILGSFEFPKRPLNRMFSGLIKLVFGNI
ncbi:hypothetical protein P9112_011064 [Eukaryota sp. TZLM1-RC]